MTNKAGEQPTITQADRDAAAAYWKVSMIGSSMTQKLYKSGEFDSSLIVQAFARHRTTSLAAQDGLDWKEQHENLLAVRHQDIAALQSKIESLEAQLKFKNEAINLTKGCPGNVVIRDGFYVLDCYKKKHKPALSTIKGDKS